MQRILCFLLIITNVLFADTFTHKETKKTFVGYRTNIKKQDKTLIRTSPGFIARYIDCNDYEVKYNLQGRRNKVIVIYLEGDFSSQSAIDVVKERLDLHANQGPFLVILEIGKIEEGYLSNFKLDINRKIQEKQNTEIVAIIKEEPNDIEEIIKSCSKAYYLKDFAKIREVYDQIADDFLLEKFKVTKDRYIAGVQNKYLSAKGKTESLMERINSYVKSIVAYQKKLPGLLARYKKAKHDVDLANENYSKVHNLKRPYTGYKDIFLREYGYEIVDMKRIKKRCEGVIKNIKSLNRKVIYENKKILFYVKAYPELQEYSNSVSDAINRAKDASKKASDAYKTIR